MFPFRYSSIFRSRWIALLWAIGVIWIAVDVAGSPDSAPESQVVNPEQIRQAEQLLEKIEK